MTLTFEGHAIVSADGMIADAAGEMPPALRNDADWTQFQAALDRAALVVLGRKGHERHPNPGRRRLVLTQRICRACRAGGENAWLWNPDGMAIDDGARRRSGSRTGSSRSPAAPERSTSSRRCSTRSS